MGLYIALMLLLAACAVGGVGVMRAIRSADLTKEANPLFYTAAFLALAAAVMATIDT